jgi:hypothetical protein
LTAAGQDFNVSHKFSLEQDMPGSADLWMLAVTFVLCWYGLGAAAYMANEGQDKQQIGIMFFGNRNDEGLPWWGVAMTTGMIGMTVAGDASDLTCRKPAEPWTGKAADR